MKRLFLILVLAITAGMAHAVFAGDLPEAIITMPDVDMFIGEITETGDGEVRIDVYHALFDCYDVASITVQQFTYMGGGKDGTGVPRVGDYVAVTAEYKDDRWKFAFEENGYLALAAQCDSLDPTALQLYGTNEGLGGFLERMNEYINDGTYSHENRKKIWGQTNASEPAANDETAAEATADSGAGDDAKSVQVINETQIVLHAPLVQKQADAGIAGTIGYWYDKPYVRYPLITLLSMAASYFMTKKIACKIEGKER